MPASSETPVASPRLPRRSSALRRLFHLTLLTLAVLTVLYFVGTSSAFLKRAVLPRASAALGAKISAGDISLSPFRRLHIRQFKLETSGAKPVAEAEEVLARYSLTSLLRGKIALAEVSLVAPTLYLEQRADGTSNLDPLLEASAPQDEAPKVRTTPELQIDQVTVKRANFTLEQAAADGTRQRTEVQNLNLTLSGLGNERQGKAEIEGRVLFTLLPAAGQPPSQAQDSLDARLGGSIDFSLDKELMPTVVKGGLRLAVAPALGRFKDLNSLNTTLALDLSATEIREVALRFEKESQRLGQIRLAGPYDLKGESRLQLDVVAIDRNVLNLFGAPLGLDFGDTSLGATCRLVYVKRGETLALNGKVNAAQFMVRQSGQATPPLDFQLEYQFLANLNDKSAVIQKLALTGTQASRELVTASLDRPMNLSWGKTVHGLNESVVKVALKDLRLDDWRMFLGTNAPSATIGAQSQIRCQQDGQRFAADLHVEVRNLVAEAGDYRLRQGEANLQATATFSDYRSLLIDHYSLDLSERSLPLLHAAGSAGFDRASGDAHLQVALESDLTKVAQVFPVPNLQVSAGKLSLESLFNQGRKQQTLTANLTLAELQGAYGPYRLNQYEARAALDAQLSEKYLNLGRASLTARQGTDTFGSLEISGSYDRQIENGDFKLNIDGLTQSGLQPLLAPFLAPRLLESVLVKGTGTLHFQPKAASQANLDLEVSRLVVHDPEGVIPRTPFNLQLQADSTYQTNLLSVRRLVLAIPPTTRARNQLRLEGVADLTHSNAITASFKLNADSLDLTPLYDAFATNRPATTAAAPTTPSTPAPETEPPPVDLPLRRLDLALQVDQLYLHEIVITNWTAAARYDTGALAIQPLKLALNGAPVTAHTTLDLSKPGYVYDFNLQAEKVPLDPVVTSFAPDRRGQLQGNLNASLQLKGAGITGPNLQKNLAGQFDFATTNLNLSLGQVRSSMLKSLVNVILGIPEILRNPAAGLGNLLSQLTGTGQRAGSGWVDQLSNSPINVVALRGTAGNGRIDLQQTTIQSPAFLAEARGTVTLAPVLTNSTLQIPVAVSLSQPLAQRIGMTTAATTNLAYVKLPDFVTMKGTVGEPKTEVNHLALLAVTAKAGAGLIGNTGNASLDQAAGVLSAVGNLVGGGSGTARTNAPTPTPTTTNAPASSPANTLLNAVGGLLGGGATRTNPPPTTPTSPPPPASATNAPPPSPANTLFNAVGGLLGSRTNRPASTTNAPAQRK